MNDPRIRQRSLQRRSLAATAAGALALALLPASSAFAAHGEICPPPGETATDAFSDDDGTQHEDNIDCVVQYGIAQGFEDGTYRPNTAVTRGQMATFIANYVETATGETLPAGSDAFEDDDGTEHEPRINKLANAGIVEGDASGRYNPGQRVNRAQMASFIARATEFVLGQELPTGGDAFTDDDGTEHEENINKLAEAGIVEGRSAGQYDPELSVGRGAMATFVINGAAYLYTQDAWAPVPFDGDSPIGAAAVIDQSPELVSVMVDEQSTTTTRLRFTFDESVAGRNPTAANFHVITVDGEREDGESAFVETADTNSVLVTFNINQTRWSAFSVATVDFDAVRDSDANENPENAVDLQSVTSEGGITTEPDLLEVRDFETSRNTVDFVFDEEVAEVVTPTGFQLIDASGDRMQSTAATVDTNDRTVVEVTFADIDSTTEGETARAVAQTNAVDDNDPNDTDSGQEGETGNPLQIVEVVNSGLTQGEPDLVSISFDAQDDIVRYTFDEPVERQVSQSDPLPLPVGEQPGGFNVYDRQGRETTGTPLETTEDNGRTVVVEFDPDAVDEAVGANVEANAVVGTTGSSPQPNEADELPGDAVTLGAGLTTAPDLIDARVEPGTTNNLRVAYVFDENVATANAADFFIYDVDGERTAGTTAEVDSTDSSVVFVTFGANSDAEIRDAVLATVDDGAATDDGGSVNPEGASELDQQQQ